MARADGQRRAPPGVLFRSGDTGVEPGGFLRGAGVLPCDRRSERAAAGVHEHVGVDLTAKPTAATRSARSPLSTASNPAMTPSVQSLGSCSTIPGAGRDVRYGRLTSATTRPWASNSAVLIEVVPTSTPTNRSGSAIEFHSAGRPAARIALHAPSMLHAARRNRQRRHPLQTDSRARLLPVRNSKAENELGAPTPRLSRPRFGGVRRIEAGAAGR